MSKPSRKRPGPAARRRLLIVILVIAIVGLRPTESRRSGGTALPADQKPVTARSLRTRALYDIVFAIAVAIFVRSRG